MNQDANQSGLITLNESAVTHDVEISVYPDPISVEVLQSFTDIKCLSRQSNVRDLRSSICDSNGGSEIKPVKKNILYIMNTQQTQETDDEEIWTY